MPKRASTRPLQARPAPYNLRKPTTATSNIMAATLVSPMAPSMQWPMHHQASTQNWTAHGMTAYHHQPMMADYSQSLQAPSLNVTAPETIRRSGTAAQGSGPWTAEMDAILIEAHASGRLKWDQIAEIYFPGQKSGNACRKRFARCQEERRATDWDDARIQRVIRAYNRDGFRERLWGLLADETGERWQDVEKLCFGQGLRQMTGRSRSSNGHARSRSLATSGNSAISDHDHSSTGEEYDDPDDSGIGLGVHQQTSVGSGRHRHSHSTPSLPVTSGGHIDNLLNYPSHAYTYSTL